MMRITTQYRIFLEAEQLVHAVHRRLGIHSTFHDHHIAHDLHEATFFDAPFHQVKKALIERSQCLSIKQTSLDDVAAVAILLELVWTYGPGVRGASVGGVRVSRRHA